MAQQISESELMRMKIIWKNGGAMLPDHGGTGKRQNEQKNRTVTYFPGREKSL